MGWRNKTGIGVRISVIEVITSVIEVITSVIRVYDENGKVPKFAS
jgi:hypothetical protein